MIDHRHAIDLAATAIDFVLDEADRLRLDEHLRACGSCRAEALAFRSDSAALDALPAIEPPSWVRRAIGQRHGPRRAVLLVAAALVLVATVGVALAVGAVFRQEVAPDVPPSTAPGPTHITVTPRPSVEASPSASTPVGPPPLAKPTSFPAGSGSAWMGPGPDGGVWVLADHSGGVGADATSVTVLGLLDGTGRPRPGWPIALTGWRCVDDTPPRGLAVAADGSIRLVCAEDTTSDGPQRHAAFAFDAAGRALPGWPVELPDSGLSTTTVVVGNELRILASEVASMEGQTSSEQAAAWWLIGVSASGEVRIGQRYAVADAAGSFDVRIASDGLAYRVAFSGGPDTEQTAITAIDFDGQRPGWPVTVDGIASQPVAGPDGRLFITRRLGQGASARAQTMTIDPAGGEATAASDGLPIDPLDDRTGAGSEVLTPMVAADGATIVVGSDKTGQRIFVVNPPVAGRGVAPASLKMPLQPMGVCSPQDIGCGVWRALPALGPDGTLFVPESVVGEGGGLSASAGGALVAIAPDGSTPAGWPITLADSMAGYWSVVPRADGTIDALTVVPTDKGNQWTLVILGPDGKTRASTVVLLP